MTDETQVYMDYDMPRLIAALKNDAEPGSQRHEMIKAVFQYRLHDELARSARRSSCVAIASAIASCISAIAAVGAVIIG